MIEHRLTFDVTLDSTPETPEQREAKEKWFEDWLVGENPTCDCGLPMRKHGTRPDPDTGEPRQRWRCKANHVLTENARPRIDPDRRRPPPCPVIVGEKRCGKERSWWCKKPELRAHCPVHGRRRLTDEEIAAYDTGQPYPEPKKVFKPRDLRKVKA